MSSSGAAAPARKNILVLFDVDGTLTPSRKAVTPATTAFLAELRGRVTTGMVGGSDLPKQLEQLGEGVLHMFDYVFPENGLKAFKDGALIGQTSFLDKLGEARLQALVNFVLGYLSTLDIPKKRGTFIEFRTGMLNVSPIGRNCSQAERDEFEAYDAAHKVRATMIAALQAKFPDYNLKYSIGGQISFDVFPVVREGAARARARARPRAALTLCSTLTRNPPRARATGPQGWDKTFCLKYVEAEGFDEIHFFGDKTFEGGNDYEIFVSPLVKGHTVTSPEDTEAQCRKLFMA